jgi:2-phospho-L-lactate guanylyltransferase (CobY/MobA/RfbA family)
VVLALAALDTEDLAVMTRANKERTVYIAPAHVRAGTVLLAIQSMGHAHVRQDGRV